MVKDYVSMGYYKMNYSKNLPANQVQETKAQKWEHELVSLYVLLPVKLEPLFNH